MIANVSTLRCPTPVGQPLPREALGETKPVSISATRTSMCSNRGRGFATRSGAAEAARVRLGKAAKIGVDFILVPNTPEPGRWSWTLPKAKLRPDRLIVGSVAATMVDMALRPQGVARAELREALGWKCDPYSSLLSACDKAGVELTVLKDGKGPFRYRGRRS